jgi:hypothetical protein
MGIYWIAASRETSLVSRGARPTKSWRGDASDALVAWGSNHPGSAMTEVDHLPRLSEYRVPYFAHRGNNSQTLQYQAGKRFAEYLDQGRKIAAKW